MIVLVDGRSGSGKSEFAAALVDGWPEAQLLRLDVVYPGWDGLEAGSQHLHDNVLATDNPRWQRWDWATDEPAEWNLLDPTRPIIVEGSGSLSRANRALADAAIWVQFDDTERKRRALERDGEMYAPHWDQWAAQEEAFVARENPASLADGIVDGRDVAAAAEVWRAILHPARVGE